MMLHCGMTVKILGTVAVSVRKMECEVDATDIDGSERERHSLVKADGMRRVLCIKYIKLIAKYFFSADVLLLGGV